MQNVIIIKYENKKYDKIVKKLHPVINKTKKNKLIDAKIPPVIAGFFQFTYSPSKKPC